MNLKIKFLISIFITFCCIQVYAANVQVTIEPSGNANGKITANIKDIPPVAKDRLILLSFHIQMKPNVPSSVPLFNGWYCMGEKNQLWIGDILNANASELNFCLDLPSIMHEKESDTGLYELNLSVNTNEGLHTFLPDSTEKTIIIPINKIIFNEGKEYKIVDESTNWDKNKKSGELEFSCKTDSRADLYVTCSRKSPKYMWLLTILSPIFIALVLSIWLKDKKWLVRLLTCCIVLTIYYSIIYFVVFPFDFENNLWGLFSILFAIIPIKKFINE